jgi:hypothetical protein
MWMAIGTFCWAPVSTARSEGVSASCPTHIQTFCILFILCVGYQWRGQMVSGKLMLDFKYVLIKVIWGQYKLK